MILSHTARPGFRPKCDGRHKKYPKSRTNVTVVTKITKKMMPERDDHHCGHVEIIVKFGSNSSNSTVLELGPENRTLTMGHIATYHTVFNDLTGFPIARPVALRLRLHRRSRART